MAIGGGGDRQKLEEERWMRWEKERVVRLREREREREGAES